MKDHESMHLKIQEMADCYATTDHVTEMSSLAEDTDREQAAIKWLALAILHGINGNAKKITVKKTKNAVKVKAEYRITELPGPPADIGERIMKAAREITHIEKQKGKLPVSIGIRDSSINLVLKVEKENDGEKLTIKFPED